MATRTLKVLTAALAASAALGLAVPAQAASIGTGSLALAPAHVEATKVGYWYRGRWYGGCWNCRPVNGAAVGAGVALGVLGAAAIAGAAAAPPPPVVYVEPAPRVYVEPAPRVYLEPAPRPGRCWVETDSRGYGYWSAC